MHVDVRPHGRSTLPQIPSELHAALDAELRPSRMASYAALVEARSAVESFSASTKDSSVRAAAAVGLTQLRSAVVGQHASALLQGVAAHVADGGLAGARESIVRHQALDGAAMGGGFRLPGTSAWTDRMHDLFLWYLLFLLCLIIGSLVFHLTKRAAADAPGSNQPLLSRARLSVPMEEPVQLDPQGTPTHTQSGFRTSILGQLFVYVWMLQPVAMWTFLGACVAAHYGAGDPLGITKEGNEFDSETQPFLWAVLFSSIYLVCSKEYAMEFLMFFMTSCALCNADAVVVESKDNKQLCMVHVENERPYFFFMCFRYTFVKAEGRFRPVGKQSVNGAQAHSAFASGGMAQEDVEDRRFRMGKNEIVVHVDSVVMSLFHEFHSKVYIYQFQTTWFSLFFDYWNVGILWLTLILVSGTFVSIFIKRANKLKIQEMASLHVDVQVLRDGKAITMPCEDLVPGEMLIIPSNSILPCDCVVVSGAVVVGEAMLTGEPMPITKVAIDPAATGSAGANTLFSGTEVLDVSGSGEHGTVAVVTAIGGATQKADLLRAVLFPSEVFFQYVDDLRTVYIGLVCYALCLFVILACANYPFNRPGNKSNQTAIFVRALFCIMQAINPMLGVAIASGQSNAAMKLTRKGISCLDPQRVPIAGCINKMVLDKTGTITKDGMELVGVQECKDGTSFIESCKADNFSDAGGLAQLTRYILASTHKLSLARGQLVGNHVEMEMFKAQKQWQLDVTQTSRAVTDGRERIEVLRVLDFDHSRMTSGVVCKLPSGESYVFIKGAANAINGLCSAGVPADFMKVSDEWSSKGYYVLGVGCRIVSGSAAEPAAVAAASRDELEAGLKAQSLLIFANELKPDSKAALEELAAGSVSCVMCTGDHLLSGVSVARKAGIIAADCVAYKLRVHGRDVNWDVLSDPLATGSGKAYVAEQKEWDKLVQHPDLVAKELPKISVFGRFRPDGKVSAVEEFQRLGYYVGMCGDGGNDCGALRAAHAGLALSEAEASIVAPFSSGANKSLFRLGEVLKEGRACIATNIALFYFYVAYGFALTSMKTSLLLINGATMATYQWFFLDIFLVLFLPSGMTHSAAVENLSRFRPSCSLLTARPMLNVAGSWLIFAVYFAMCIKTLRSYDFFMYWDPETIGVGPAQWNSLGDNFETSVGLG
eukprot:TRINITY_DN25139_c0_g1_i3.p1 TRINITY_DN25139_c0_g1~~TRINITY_DN25139_c0_g1_i3.p1  ORF type:complete len:1163 (-),score=155.87 TRINITY_DN25139_c0_g1_i3:504-3992(-)